MRKLILTDIGRIPPDHTTLLLLASCVSLLFFAVSADPPAQIRSRLPGLTWPFPPPPAALSIAPIAEHLRLACLAHVQSLRAFQRIYHRGVIVCKR